jgi:antirestriction protein ArdC
MEVRLETKIIIPLRDNDGADNGPIIERAVIAFCAAFGGATAWDAHGYWVNPEGKLYAEPVRVIVSAAADAAKAKRELQALARAVLDLTDQEAVFVSVGGEADIISR